MESNMNTNEINASYTSVEYNYSASYKSTSVSSKKTDKSEADRGSSDKVSKDTTSKETSKSETSGVVYESSNIKNMSKEERASLVEKLKADAEARVSQLRSLVESMFLKQGEKVQSTNDMWKFLSSGDFTVDRATAEAAKESISEDGYWGVKQTSQRIFDMAVALSGGDSDKMDDMLEAFKKGFKQATEAWGKELPDISQQTYGAVLEKFEAYKQENTASSESTEAE